MFKEVADIKTADMLELPVPEAHFHNVAVKPSEMQKEMVASLAERAEKVRGGGVDSSVDNMLKITNDGRKLALDQRMLNDMLPDFEGSKINACVDNIYRIWEETADKKSAQLVFCDLSTPKNDGTFSVYNDIRKKLIERGVPESEVRFIHEADTDVKKKELFQKTRKGEVRVLLGSTQKMGAGTNVQDRLIALHDVDCPWRPSDLEQRSGRIIRQGNSNPDVDIYRYVTEQTFDAYLYQLVEGKQKFASQIMTSKSPVRSAEDIDETALSYAEIKMLATGNPYIKEKMDLDIQVQKLKLLKSNFLSEKYALEDKIIKYYPQRITALENRIEGLKQDVETAKQHPKPTDDRFVGMEVKGVFYSEKADAGKAIIEACKQMNSPDPIPLGKYRGFETELLFNTAERNYEVRLKGATSRNVPLGDDAHGNIIRLDNGIERFAESLSLAENDLENTTNQLETAKKEVQKPFIQEEELKTKLARLDELNILLNMDKRENEIVGGEPDEGEVPNTRKHPKPTDDRFVGMEVKGVFYSEKADAGKAIIEACKQMNSPDPIPLGKYRGFETELLFNTAERNYEVRLKGATSRNVPLGDDAHGNIIRLDNGIERFAESLSLAENDLENTTNQLETAKKEVQKPFIQEEELKTKLARLDELNILLNMDKRENEIVGGEPDEGEVPNTRKTNY